MFGIKLKELRRKNNENQSDIAKILGVTRATVSNWEAGKGSADGELLKIIAEHYNVTTDYLLGLNQNEENKINKLKLALKETGMLNDDEDIAMEDFEKALQIVNMLKQNKDTK